MLLDIKLEAEAQFVQLTRLKKYLIIEEEEYNYETYEEKATGWSRHPTEFIDEERVNLEETLSAVGEINIFTDGSKMEQGVGSAFCVFGQQQELIAEWQGRLSPKNSIFQAELIALQEAVKYAQNHQKQVKIWSNSESSLKALLNKKSNSPIARSIQDYLYNTHNIRLGWIRDHVGHLGSDKADELANEAITSKKAAVLTVPLQRSSAKQDLKQRARAKWQSRWDDGINGRSTYEIIKKAEL
ncbi:hypothetical protein AVEN_230333-1 [Araneus ventricosus]|uniref:RNase H type-1 domain-containing protein n=1 Tax=Araneus ventricosus TaxID=182803 RepID=A0A4Y2TWW4_ARAVE|nr:hypothetical protein AVEN_230333-1 [Araneus ventricosus]